MTIEELKARPDFVTELGPQQKEWVAAYCSNGADKLEATRTAYPNTAEDGLLTVANRCLRHPAIKRIVTDFYGRKDETGTRAELLAIAWKEVQSSMDPKEKLAYLNFIAKMKNFFDGADGTPEDDVDWVSQLERVKGA